MTYDLNNLLTGNDSGGTWANGTCGSTSTTTPFAISGSIVTIPDGSSLGSYAFNYYFSATTSCAAECAEVLLLVSANPNAGTGTTTMVMVGDTVNLFSLLTGEQAGGTWGDTNFSGFNITNPTAVVAATIGTYIFTYTVTSTNCGSDSEQVTIIVSATCPEAGVFTGVTNTVCIN